MPVALGLSGERQVDILSYPYNLHNQGTRATIQSEARAGAELALASAFAGGGDEEEGK